MAGLSDLRGALGSAVVDALDDQRIAQMPTFDQMNQSGDYNRGQTGVYAEYPRTTPKYAVNKGLRENEFKDTLARFYISLSSADPKVIANYLANVPPEAKALAKVLVGGNEGKGTGFIDFFLQQVNESFTETAQVEKVLSDNYVAFFFGQEPPMFQYSGMLLNSRQDDQRLGMAMAYQHLIRGTQLARRGALLRVRYDSVIVSGMIMSMSQSLNAENELAVPFQFSLLVKEYLILTPPQNIVAKATTAFDLSGSLVRNSIGRGQDVRVRTLAVPSKMSDISAAGDDENAPTTTPVSPAERVQEGVAVQTVEPHSDVAPGTTVNVSGPIPPNRSIP